MARDGAALVDGIEGARQRLRDALRTPRGSYPFARDYGSSVPDLVDRNVDAAFESRVYAAIVETVAHAPNGLADIRLTEVAIIRCDGCIEVLVRAAWARPGSSPSPIDVRQALAA